MHFPLPITISICHRFIVPVGCRDGSPNETAWSNDLKPLKVIGPGTEVKEIASNQKGWSDAFTYPQKELQMPRYLAVCVTGLGLMAAVLTACGGIPAQAQVQNATNTVAPANTVEPSKVIQPTIESNSASTPIVSHGGPVVDYVSLIDTLRAGGATVDPNGSITQPFFAPAGAAIKVNGSDVQVFEYADKASADAEAAKVAPDGGSVGTSMVSWMDAPHFYKAGKIIVLYVGSDANIIGVLIKAAGLQFAGR